MSACPHSSKSKAPSPKTGVLLVNLGTPDGYDYRSMRRYLAEFLMDKRVVDLSRWLWCPLLHFVILSLRPQKAGAAYKKIWNTARDESPLRTITRAQADAVQAQLGDDVKVSWGMRYGQPSIQAALQELHGCKTVILLPLYPQYAGATVGSVMDAVGKAMPSLKFTPALQTVAPYYDDPAYIQALAASVRTQYKNKPLPEVLLTSFHGLPVRYCKEGDPYFCHCHKTARLLAEALGWDFVPDWRENFPAAKNGVPRLVFTFQSIFGREEWLQPYTDKTLEILAAEHSVKHAGIITPGFSADCVETLEEINIEARESFMSHGGEQFDFVPCLNESDTHISLITKLLKKFI